MKKCTDDSKLCFVTTARLLLLLILWLTPESDSSTPPLIGTRTYRHQTNLIPHAKKVRVLCLTRF